MAVIRTKIVFDASPEFRQRWLRLCGREGLSQAEMFRRLVAEALAQPAEKKGPIPTS